MTPTLDSIWPKPDYNKEIAAGKPKELCQEIEKLRNSIPSVENGVRPFKEPDQYWEKAYTDSVSFIRDFSAKAKSPKDLSKLPDAMRKAFPYKINEGLGAVDFRMQMPKDKYNMARMFAITSKDLKYPWELAKTKKTPTIQVNTVKEKKPIEHKVNGDIGYIPGAAKYRYTKADVAQANDDKLKEMAQLKKVWPEPKYDELAKTKGRDFCVGVAQLRKGLAKTPNTGTIDFNRSISDRNRKVAYIQSINFMRDYTEKCKTLDELKQVSSAFQKQFPVKGKYEYLSDATDVNDQRNIYREFMISKRRGKNTYKPWSEMSSLPEDIKLAEKMNWPQEDIKEMKSTSIRKIDGDDIKRGLAPPNSEGKYGAFCRYKSPKKEYNGESVAEGSNPEETIKRAQDYFRGGGAKYVIKEQIKPVNERDKWRRPAVKNLPPPQIKNKTAEDLKKTFGFNRIQFGNTMTPRDRQAVVNHAYTGFLQMAKALNRKPGEMSLGGKLSLAFGARGVGNATAHYEPGENVINLTKMNGAGSLAHEWFHALDYASGKPSGEKQPFYQTAYSDKPMSTIMSVANKSDFGKKAKEMGKYWSESTEVGARLFETMVNDKFKKQGVDGRFMVNGVDNIKDENLPYPVGRERKILNAHMDRFISQLKIPNVRPRVKNELDKKKGAQLSMF